MAYLKVRVTPGAREDTLVGWRGDVLRLRVRATAERGKANEAALRLLAARLNLPPGKLGLARGAASRDKLVFVDGLSENELRERIRL